ncbi:hypothetical protein Plav_2949 [Parvibaculum lavamentivorans DS-1]|uniref:Uncharacterized protein n=1 Tax=Parvibaculum lavamentivorans (strain DS-1 / DSM 13023 / NCIMB 13966) TaxID=402881 RepID=A7HXC3_PARL1|nr:hypothetical protein [Parvibaculum lavamentivorans]ABS64556.1 hypothetical protein Plav_2949 [Parvibaculum lavamentivorans DS-1]
MKFEVILAAAIMASGSLCAARAEARDLSNGERTVIAEAVKQYLLDPESAMFRWGPLGPGDKYCAEVKSNTFLGEEGVYQPFIVAVEDKAGRVARAEVLMMESAETMGTVKDICELNGYDAAYFRSLK